MNALTHQVVVQRREIQGGGVVVLDLQSADGSSLPSFEAGAHIDVHLGPDLVRQYSLCGDPAEKSRYRLGVLRDPASRGGSLAVFDRLNEGTVITIGAPRNHFPLVPEAQHSVLVGGGIGITPMLAMAYACQRRARASSCITARALPQAVRFWKNWPRPPSPTRCDCTSTMRVTRGGSRALRCWLRRERPIPTSTSVAHRASWTG